LGSARLIIIDEPFGQGNYLRSSDPRRSKQQFGSRHWFLLDKEHPRQPAIWGSSPRDIVSDSGCTPTQAAVARITGIMRAPVQRGCPSL
jgi:hypothetical protein